MITPQVYGKTVDDETRCVHYASARDIVALKFGCCERYYPCFKCHDETADHKRRPWPVTRSTEPAVLCGACKSELFVSQYIDLDHCPACNAAFNPGCTAHYDRYFEEPIN